MSGGKGASTNISEPREKITDKMINAFKIFPGSNNMTGKKEEPKKEEGETKEPNSSFDIQELENAPLEKLSKCDSLFEEIREFLGEAKETIDFTRKSKDSSIMKVVGLPPVGISAAVNKWRAKRKGNTLFAKFENISSKIEDADKMLKTLTDSSLSDSSSLMVQSLFIKRRLKSCVEYNESATKEGKANLAVIKDLVANMRRSENAMQAMLSFVDEVSSLREKEGQVGNVLVEL
jgi:predicted transcriptional regulator